MNAQAKIEAPPNIVGALAIALPELGAVTKNKKNPHFKSSYADLSAVIQALAPIAEHGLWFRQEPRDDAGSVGFETFYIYRDGSELSAGVTRIPVNKNDAQGYGSAQTYCRRYALQAAFGLAAEDDDGNAAAKAKPEPVAQAEMSDGKRQNWGGRYPTKTALKQAMHAHNAELERIALEGTFDDLDAYMTSPEYQDYIKQADEHAPVYLTGGEPAPPEYVGTFDLETKARDMIAIRGNVPADKEPA